MSRGAFAALAATAIFATAGNAAAATPQQIYRDLADNGKLDRHYSPRDINRALRNPSIQGYAKPERAARRPQVAPRVKSGSRLSVASARDALPFSDLDFALFGGVGGPLLLIGAGMRRLARSRVKES